ncbi:MAG TPA: SLOG family protein [Nitrospira sp.]|nr:SLOG family protein [Nitrospira sp.]
MSGELLPMIVAATGHRPPKLGGYAETVHRRCVTVATRWLEAQEEACEGRIKCVRVGMALGWDQAVAQACVDVDVPFHAYVPFRGQELRWPDEAQVAYKVLLNKAEEIVYCSPPGYSPAKMQKRNAMMVDGPPIATHVLALWNGTNGGTANCVDYANMRKVPVINLWDWYLGRP